MTEHTADLRRAPKWRVPKGTTIEAVIRDAARQVLKNYGETLRKLADR